MKKKLTPFLVVLFFLSIGLNVILVIRYSILEKTLYRLGRAFLNPPTKTLSEPLDRSTFRKFSTVHYLTKNTISEVVKSSEIESKDIPNQLIMRPGIFKFQGESYALKKEGLYKNERIINSKQNAKIEVNNKSVLNFCANNYLGLSSSEKYISWRPCNKKYFIIGELCS